MAADWFRKKTWTLAHDRHLEIGARARIMGILNVTPDSFSDAGDFVELEVALQKAATMLEQGASVIDVGGESTRPDSDGVDGETERARVLPVIVALAQQTEAIISIDTYRAQTAREAVEAGAHIINDVWGCQKEPELAQVAADTGAGLCIMHTSRERDVCDDVIADQVTFLRQSLSIARAAGVRDEQIVLDPGFGFAKDTQLNLQLLNRLDEIVDLGFPVLVGTSRKRFLGEITGRDAIDRGMATAATSVIARQKGAAIFRVHDIVENRDALAVADALIKMGNGKLQL